MNEAVSSPDVTVVVPTFRRPALLRTALGALAVQTLAFDRFEVVVADDDPDGPTGPAVRSVVDAFHARFPAGPRVRYVPVSDTQGPAAARNAGWRAADAPVVAFTDDDTVPDREWLAGGLAAIAAGDDAVAGAIAMPLAAAPSDYERDAARLADAEFATANCFVRRPALVAVDGFDERFTAAWREDSDLQFTLIEAGFRVGRAPNAIVVHPVRPARTGVSIAQQRKAYFEALLFRKHRALYRSRIDRGCPVHYYANVAALVVAIAAAAYGAPDVAWVALATWLASGLAFAAYRLRRGPLSATHVADMVGTSLVLPTLSVFWRLRGAWRFRVFFL